jgi:hypothetical protein
VLSTWAWLPGFQAISAVSFPTWYGQPLTGTILFVDTLVTFALGI